MLLKKCFLWDMYDILPISQLCLLPGLRSCFLSFSWQSPHVHIQALLFHNATVMQSFPFIFCSYQLQNNLPQLCILICSNSNVMKLNVVCFGAIKSDINVPRSQWTHILLLGDINLHKAMTMSTSWHGRSRSYL